MKIHDALHIDGETAAYAIHHPLSVMNQTSVQVQVWIRLFLTTKIHNFLHIDILLFREAVTMT
jgi:hypothetical protein